MTACREGTQKKKAGNQHVLCPLPVTIVGAFVNGRVNFLNGARVGILNAAAPHLILLGRGKVHDTAMGIRENGTLSVNILSQDRMVEMDHGQTSHARDQAAACFLLPPR